MPARLRTFTAPAASLLLIVSLAAACSFGDAAPTRNTVVEPSEWITDPERAPFAVHLTWQRDPSSAITLQWQTPNHDIEGYVPRVWFVPVDEMIPGENGAPAQMPFEPRYVAQGEGFTYTANVNRERVPRGQYTVEITGLRPNTRYLYRAGTWERFDEATRAFVNPTLTDQAEFTTAPAKGSREPFRFIAAGDSRGGYDGIRAAIQPLRDLGADFWLFNGDMTNGGGQVEWYTWFDAMAPLLRDTVLMPVQGNHEIVADLYYWQFALPSLAELEVNSSGGDLREHAWSLDYGNVHLVGLDSNGTYNIQGQLDWLDADLGRARSDPDIDWILVMHHHPAYSACRTHGSTTDVITHWVPILERHGVDMSFSGHDHNYERTHAVRGGSVASDGDGVVYIVAGSFFSPPYSAGTDWWTLKSRDGDGGNLVLVEVNGRQLDLTVLAGDATTVIDQFTLRKP